MANEPEQFVPIDEWIWRYLDRLIKEAWEEKRKREAAK